MTRAGLASPPELATANLLHRVRDRRAFDRLRREGRRVRNGPMWCSFVHDTAITPPQIAFAIGRPVGPAVTRNLLRRRLRAILGDMDVPSGLYLFGGRPTMSELTFVELKTRVAALLDAAQPLRTHS